MSSEPAGSQAGDRGADETAARGGDHGVPRAEIASTVLDQGKLLSHLTITFTNGTVWEFDVPKAAKKTAQGLVGALGEALGQRLEGRSVRSARRVLRKRFELDPAELPPAGRLVRPKGRRTARVAIRSQEASEGNLLVTPSMVRVEYLSRNPHLEALTGGPRLRMRSDDAAMQGVAEGDAVKLRVGGVLRRAVVRIDDGLPPGLMLLPCLPDQPVGLARADLTTLAREERELEVAG